MKFLLFGLGSISFRHYTNLRALRPDAEIVTADPDSFSGADYTDPFQALAEHPDAAGAILASPTGFHVEQIEALAKAGVPFLVEKPPCQVGETHRLERLLPKLDGLPCAVGFNYRYHPALQELGHRNMIYLAREDLLARYGENVLEVTGSHMISIALWKLGRVLECNLQHDGRHLWGTSRHDSGLWLTPTCIYDAFIDRGPREARVIQDGLFYELPPEPRMYFAELRDWLSWLDGGPRDPRLATLQDGLDVMQVLEQAERV